MNIPILGICYGLQLLSLHYKGKVASARHREYGRAHLIIDDSKGLFEGLNPEEPLTVWMSHGDRVDMMPEGFKAIAHTDNAPIAAIRHHDRPVFAIQFHPEVAHTDKGTSILENFAVRICGCAQT